MVHVPSEGRYRVLLSGLFHDGLIWIAKVTMFVLVRAITYAALFIGLVLIYMPARLLSWSGIVRPAAIEAPQVAGMIIGAVG